MKTGPFETELDALAAALAAGDGERGPAANLALLLAACESAGVTLGAWDRRIVDWLSRYEPSTTAVVTGLISRANHG